MEINADFSKRVSMHASDMEWVESPMKGVDRRMLDRIGNEVARATTIVRYAPNSSFPAHTHTGGEEFLVLEGVFQDEYGDYPAGTYVRNPPTSSHTPRSDEGCTILVKLWQYQMDDRTHVVIDTNKIGSVVPEPDYNIATTPLFKDEYEDVRIETWSPNSTLKIQAEGGAEYFVLRGGFEEAGEIFAQNSWLRLPAGAAATFVAGNQGAKIWIKSGHLKNAAAPKFSA